MSNIFKIQTTTELALDGNLFFYRGTRTNRQDVYYVYNIGCIEQDYSITEEFAMPDHTRNVGGLVVDVAVVELDFDEQEIFDKQMF